MLSLDSNQPKTHDIFINNLKTALSSCRHLLLAEYLELLVFHCSNTCRVDLVAIMEVVCLNLLITSFSLRSCHANIMPSTNGCTSLRSDSSIPCRRSWSDKYSTIIWSALIECSMAKGTCLFIPSVSVFIADFSGGGSFYLFPFHSHCCCGLVLWYFSYFVSFMVLFWLMGVNMRQRYILFLIPQ